MQLCIWSWYDMSKIWTGFTSKWPVKIDPKLIRSISSHHKTKNPQPLVVKAAVPASGTPWDSIFTTTSTLLPWPPIRVHELHRHCNIVVGMSKRGLGLRPSPDYHFCIMAIAAKCSLMPISFFDIENNHALRRRLTKETPSTGSGKSERGGKLPNLSRDNRPTSWGVHRSLLVPGRVSVESVIVT